MSRVVVPLVLTPDRARPTSGRRTGFTGIAMGVGWSLTAVAPAHVSDGALKGAVQRALDEVVAQMSHWEPASDLCRFNAAPAGAWVDIPDPFFQVMDAALALARSTDGAFDPTLGAVVDLWGFGPRGGAGPVPDDGDLGAAVAGWGDLEVDRQGRRLRQPGGLQLDLSGIAKGFGVDHAARAVERLGVRDYLVDVGGELRGAGVKPNGEPWWVELESPPDALMRTTPIVAALHDLSVATSGDWRRSFQAEGRRYSHTIDGRTRAPVGEEIASVSVLHPECMWADAYATAITVLGPRAGAEYAQANDIRARILLREADGVAEWLSPAFEAMLA